MCRDRVSDDGHAVKRKARLDKALSWPVHARDLAHTKKAEAVERFLAGQSVMVSVAGARSAIERAP